MNNNIIKKCLEELQKESFRKDYVIGMLETLYEMNNRSELVTVQTPINNTITTPPPTYYTTFSTSNDEGEMLDKVAQARLNEVKKNTKYE